MERWRFYNHAMLPTTAPYENIDTNAFNNNAFWKKNGKNVLFARWTTDFDCGYETEWWYVILDTPFDISLLKAKRRYEITKGRKYFEIKRIDPRKYMEALYETQLAAFSAYPEKYRPKVDRESFYKSIDEWKESVVFGAFYKGTNELCGYAQLNAISEVFINYNVQKTKPEFERFAINAALIDGVLSYHKSFLEHGGMISDGERSVNHETRFQDYLEKYFLFRKAYCKLQIRYNAKLGWVISILYPFRKFLLKFDKNSFIHRINSVLKMEMIIRRQNKRY